MDASQKILSDLTVYMKYAKFVPELNRRETWEELVTRNMDMHIKKYPSLKDEIKECLKVMAWNLYDSHGFKIDFFVFVK